MSGQTSNLVNKLFPCPNIKLWPHTGKKSKTLSIILFDTWSSSVISFAVLLRRSRKKQKQEIEAGATDDFGFRTLEHVSLYCQYWIELVYPITVVSKLATVITFITIATFPFTSIVYIFLYHLLQVTRLIPVTHYTSVHFLLYYWLRKIIRNNQIIRSYNTVITLQITTKYFIK